MEETIPFIYWENGVSNCYKKRYKVNNGKLCTDRTVYMESTRLDMLANKN